jgi:hypothetical protein
MEGLSLTPPDPISPEYARMNGLLKMLHLNRGTGDSREERPKLASKDLEGRRLQPLRSLATATPQKVPSASKQPDDEQVNDKKIDEQKEKDSVTSIYEEANRYVLPSGIYLVRTYRAFQRIRKTNAGSTETCSSNTHVRRLGRRRVRGG